MAAIEPSRTTIPVSEIFQSLQGEGKLLGVPSLFIRFAGCPLKCPWCDTSRAWDESNGTQTSISDIIKTIKTSPLDHIVLTGGEPLMHPQITTLIDQIKKQDKKYHITIESAGIIFEQVAPDLLSLSPKLPSTMPNQNTINPKVLSKLISQAKDYQVKFVVKNESEVAQVQQILNDNTYIEKSNVMLMPNSPNAEAYKLISPEIAKLAIKNNLRFCSRLHLELNIQ